MKSPKTVTTTQTNAPAPWLNPYNQQYMSLAQQEATKPYTPYGGELSAGFNSDQTNAFDQVRQMAGDNQQGMDHARSAIDGTITGDNDYARYLAAMGGDTNPYLDSVVNSSLGDITRSYGGALGSQLGQFSQGGAFGGSAHQEAMANSENELAQNLGRASTGLRYQDFNDRMGRQFAGMENERSRQVGSAFNLPAFNQQGYQDANALLGIGNQQQGQAQDVLNKDYGQYLDQRNWSAGRLGLLGQASGQVGNQYNSSKVVAPNPNYQSPFQQLMGVATTAAGVMTGNPFMAMSGASSLGGGGGGGGGGGSIFAPNAQGHW